MMRLLALYLSLKTSDETSGETSNETSDDTSDDTSNETSGEASDDTPLLMDCREERSGPCCYRRLFVWPAAGLWP